MSLEPRVLVGFRLHWETVELTEALEKFRIEVIINWMFSQEALHTIFQGEIIV